MQKWRQALQYELEPCVCNVRVFLIGIFQVWILWKCINMVHGIVGKHQKCPAESLQNTLHKAFAFCASYVGVFKLASPSPSWFNQLVGWENESNVGECDKRLISHPLLISARSDIQTNHSNASSDFSDPNPPSPKLVISSFTTTPKGFWIVTW